MRFDVAGSALALLLTCASVAPAQGTSGDSLAQPPRRFAGKQAWLSIGIGAAKYAFDDGPAGRIGIHFSSGHFVAMYRSSATAQGIESSEVTDAVGLLGLASGTGSRWTAAAGLGRVNWTDGESALGTETAFAYDFAVRANKAIAGLAVNVYGTLGSPNATFIATTLSIELGWFGR